MANRFVEFRHCEQDGQMTKTRVPDDADYKHLAEFRYVMRRFLAFSEAKAVEAGLRPQQHHAMLVIRAAPSGAADVGYVAQRLALKSHSATELINRMEKLDLVSRSREGRDRRRAVLILTERGGELLEHLASAHCDEVKCIHPVLLDVLAHFTPDDPTAPCVLGAEE